MRQNELSDNPGARKARTRVGRGIGFAPEVADPYSLPRVADGGYGFGHPKNLDWVPLEASDEPKTLGGLLTQLERSQRWRRSLPPRG